MPVRIAAAQINQTVGDFDGNARRIIDAAKAAAAQGAGVLVTPELSLCGYPPEDLLLRAAFYDRCDAALARLQAETASLELHLLVGMPVRRNGLRYNAALVLHRGSTVGEYAKHDLPNYDVFDEQRYFEPANRPLVFEALGLRFGVVICEDFWYRHAPEMARASGAQVLLALNASPFHTDKHVGRIDVARENVSLLSMPIVAANLVGGQDELVFDGLSFALDRMGAVVAQSKAFETDLLLVDVVERDGVVDLEGAGAPARMPLEQQIYCALVVGVRDYLGKNGFPGAIVGLSGGIDSALTLAVAVDALGADRVSAVMMPSRYTAEISRVDAREMARRLGVRYDEIPITPMVEAFDRSLADEFRGLAQDTTEENIQARVRGTLLMAISNKFGSIVLTTGNKSEMAVGYCTLYGDMAGGFAVIKDIAKTMVYRLSDYRNGVSEVIPRRIITRPPSAELREGQLDQDSLPSYEVLDGIMQMYMEDNRSIAEITAAGYPPEAIERVVRLIRISEYKRRQAPVGIRVTRRAFGRDWRYPITSKFRD
ncbi:MAG: NAD+ synthase [Burkholderiaceae bacterium]|nr:NAD+ synthase [Burkholderiaceae bacterium]